MNFLKDLDDLVSRLDKLAEGSAWSALKDPIDRLKKSCEHFAKSFCNSVFGYHGNTYYENFEPPPPGTRFSSQWGLRGPLWQRNRRPVAEYASDDVRTAVLARAKVKDLWSLVEKAAPAREEY